MEITKQTRLIDLTVGDLIEILQKEFSLEPPKKAVGAINSHHLSESEIERIRHILLTPLSEIKLNVRPFNLLKKAGIKNLADLVSKSRQELWEIRNLGKKSLMQIDEMLEEQNRRHAIELYYNMDVTIYGIYDVNPITYDYYR